MSKNRDEHMARYLAGEMSTSEEIAFMEETQSHPKQRHELKIMEKSWKYFDNNPEGEYRDTGKAWSQLHTRIEEDGLLEDQTSVNGRARRLPALRIAASILLVLALGIPALYFGLIRSNQESRVQSHYAEKGVTTVNLPDGSRVYLNQGAEVSFPSKFNQGRDVELKGEAFFEVMSDPVNPFTVRSGKVMVSVLGTSFNVKQTDHSSNVEVYVKTGKVRMALEDSGSYITLQPEEFGQSDAMDLISSRQEDPNYISWKTKDFKFVDAELVDVLQELEDSYHVNIHVDRAELKEMKITTSYREQSIDAILETIGAAFGMTVNSKADGYYLTN
jgi:ferric-dicitrate binding protein FerR (iron transport regulator)